MPERVTLETDVDIQGKARVEVAVPLNNEKERQMAEEMAPMLATLSLLDYGPEVVAKRYPKKFEQFAGRFDVSVARAREVFKNMRLNHLECETRVGTLSVGFRDKR